jgi:hypothetical protein
VNDEVTAVADTVAGGSTRPAPASGFRLVAAMPFAIAGGACVVAGGLVAAVTASVPTDRGAWVAAYLVLVGGVAQLCLGAGRAYLVLRAPAPRRVAFEVVAWNASSAAVVGGTLLGIVPLVDAGGGVLLVTLAMLLVSVWRARGRGGPWRHLYRLFAMAVMASVPVGLLLARM